MKYGFVLAIVVSVLVALPSARAHAQNKYLCCDLAAGAASTPCVAQAASCVPSATYSLRLSDVVPDNPDAAAQWVNPLALTSSFPDGTDGYLYWSTSSPRLGFCLVAPVPGDPTHVDQQDPIGCLDVTLNPGVSGEMANVVVPVDPRWDGYQLCYGAPDPVNDCQNLNDGWDLSVSETPISHSCCSPIELFREHGSDDTTWVLGIDQDLPGVPPPVLIEQPDAGLVSSFNATLNDSYLSSADAGCLTAFNETTTCGSLPADAGAPSPSPVDAQAADAQAADASAPGVAQAGGGGGGCSVADGRPTAGLLLLVAAFFAAPFAARSRRRRRPR